MPLLERGLYGELLSYVATDVTAAFGPSLQEAVPSPYLSYKVCLLLMGSKVDKRAGIGQLSVQCMFLCCCQSLQMHLQSMHEA